MCTSFRAETSVLTCLNSHFLRRTTGLKEYYLKKFFYDKYTCRTCNRCPEQNEETFHCRKCIYDICNLCNQIIEKASTMERQVCEKQHPVEWTPDLCIKIQEKFRVCKFRCEKCGESFIGGGAYTCNSCEYYICVQCIGKNFEINQKE